MNRIERITAMEEAMNRLAAFLRLEGPLSKDALVDYHLLDDYYQNEWQKDYEADEAGRLPADLKRGVLSEDALYDLLCEADRRIEQEAES